MGVKVMRGTAAVVKKTRWKIRRNGGKKEKERKRGVERNREEGKEMERKWGEKVDKERGRGKGGWGKRK